MRERIGEFDPAQAVAMALHLAGEIEAATTLHDAVSEAGRRILSMRGMVREPPID